MIELGRIYEWKEWWSCFTNAERYDMRNSIWHTWKFEWIRTWEYTTSTVITGGWAYGFQVIELKLPEFDVVGRIVV